MMSDGVMTYEDWLRGCVYHDGRHGYVTLPCEEVLKIADFIERLRADRKTEPNNSEKPNNCEDEFFREPTAEERKAVADYIDSISVPTGVNVFDLMDEPTISKMEQVDKDINVRSKDESQTDCSWK